jgi:DNA-binding transcriptional ArsR family regulator
MQVMKQPLEQYVQLLRSAAEPTRLRILALLAAAELSVSDIAAVLGQSQPRVSRHLKVLCDAGLLSRSREQHWIYYRLADTGAPAEFVRSVLGSLDPTDPALALDLERSGALRARRSEIAATTQPAAERNASQDSGELGAVLGTELGDAPVDALLYAGHAPVAVIPALSGRVNRAVVLFTSREDLGRARTSLDGRGPARAELRLGDPRSLPFAAASFDAVIIDRVDDPDLAELREAARVLRPAGRLIVIDDYDRLEERAGGANPLIVSRERLMRAGLTCTRLRPLDLESARLLLAIAAPIAREAAA